jgi:hypothetical protein
MSFARQAMPEGLLQLAISPGATAPVPSSNGARLWSTTIGGELFWDGTAWRALPIDTSYCTLIDSSGSHTAARAAGTYWLGQSDPAGITGVGTLYPANIFYFASGDYPAIPGYTYKLRLRYIIQINDVAPACNFTSGLYSVTRPAVSGAAGLNVYTLGAAAGGSATAVLTAPAADTQNNISTSDFVFSGQDFLCIGFTASAAIAASSHVHISAVLQGHYVAN